MPDEKALGTEGLPFSTGKKRKRRVKYLKESDRYEICSRISDRERGKAVRFSESISSNQSCDMLHKQTS
jgi:hypothetical protein